MEKYLPDFDMTTGEYRYVVKSEIDQAIADVSNQKTTTLKVHNIKTGEVYQSEIKTDRYLKKYINASEWIPFEEMKDLEASVDEERNLYLNGDFN
ncbi:hypothetical protein [Acinetobacter nosocomialis]|uniref:hypothetical protein n=1 Tax=Acinetobacter nosocomialis TaxID=106654 RepID=UPI001B81D97E|nr:hypothetical protein [Acinetobacter nosocomialis]MBR7737750.1 hypothetical protein [Acinetobacter nosocomialis]